MTLQAPFPYFGGKSTVARLVWQRLGNVANYVEPFFGSGAVLLARPNVGRIETVNDKDRYVANFWRAVKNDPEAVAHWLDWPVNECDLFARHLWLVNDGIKIIERCDQDPDFFDAKVAGWWCWGLCQWIGSGWCSGDGPWKRNDDDSQRPHLGDSGKGVNRTRPHLSASGMGVNRSIIENDVGRTEVLVRWMTSLANRFRNVRVCCGDWSRVCGPSVTTRLGMTGLFIDPPYSTAANRLEGLYNQDSLTVAHDAREWAVNAGRDPLIRIVFAGYEDEHQFPSDWHKEKWKAKGGYGTQAKQGRGRENSYREVLWFSPHCLNGLKGLLELDDDIEQIDEGEQTCDT